VIEIMVFYWTGVVIWWIVSICTVATFILAAVLFPIFLYRKMEKYFWQWKWGAIAASTGLTRDDVEFAVRTPHRTPGGVTVPELMSWFEAVKTRGVVVRKLSEKWKNPTDRG